MNIKIIILSLLAMYALSLTIYTHASEYTYHQATIDDLSSLLNLINTQAIHDAEKIVIVPEKFRSFCLQSAIDKGRMFVAKNHDGEIVGYKKLFLITDKDEQNDILANEIRCMGEDTRCTFAGEVSTNGQVIQTDMPLFDVTQTTYLYTGGDFTVAPHRGKGINSALTNASLTYIYDDVKEHMKQNKSKYLALLYGITQANAGKTPGANGDRTPSIAQSFRSFAQEVVPTSQPISITHHRYQAFKPSFDPSSQELRPLPDNKSIEGFGCLLTYSLGDCDAQ
ncbi:MAG: hypothetical protein M1114_04170 [Candidatus Dependentiae bacterium]|nr:hypothetical protein [Candidatus Dependentiae bacterium]